MTRMSRRRNGASVFICGDGIGDRTGISASREAKAFVDWINGAALKERLKSATPQGQPDEKQFADQVMPILVKNCASVCHGGKNPMAKAAFPEGERNF